MDKKYISLLNKYYQLMRRDYVQSWIPLPRNSAPIGTVLQDKVLRKLDCAVIEHMHRSIKNDLAACGHSNLESFDSVRCVFIEGEPIYEDAGFHHDTHIQVCIRNPDCILGFFLPRYEIDITEELHEYPTAASL